MFLVYLVMDHILFAGMVFQTVFVSHRSLRFAGGSWILAMSLLGRRTHCHLFGIREKAWSGYIANCGLTSLVQRQTPLLEHHTMTSQARVSKRVYVAYGYKVTVVPSKPPWCSLAQTYGLDTLGAAFCCS